MIPWYVLNDFFFYSCSKCTFGKCCTNPLDISRHISKQHGSFRPFACTECPKSYLHLKDLERHFTSTHEKEGKLNGRFECEECSKVFTHLYLLNCHKMCEHAEKKPFQCDQCTQSYTSKEGVKRHKLTVHEGNYSSYILRRPLKFKEISKFYLKLLNIVKFGD